ncbi:hypothetical protein FA13DRAFT_1726112 [Coprinellus micaceus]|uniref:Uncharacterized protein n=1 Tax=Coprinellus micaceus TaxID=71717 RepID=A0A4Y7TW95_COPMI|nr:hypothetical protein FA13DRAFT_1726112 [Coprinellus micaceus]
MGHGPWWMHPDSGLFNLIGATFIRNPQCIAAATFTPVRHRGLRLSLRECGAFDSAPSHSTVEGRRVAREKPVASFTALEGHSAFSTFQPPLIYPLPLTTGS